MSPWVQERQQVKNQQSCISVFVVYPTIQVATRSTSPDMTTVFHARPYGGFTELQSNISRKKLRIINQGSNFLGGTFSNSDNAREPI